MKKLLLFALLLLIFWFYSIIKSDLRFFHYKEPAVDSVAARQMALTNDPPDVLSATNLEQWRSLIKGLKSVQMLPNQWDNTGRFRAGSPPVLLKHNGQSIIYKAADITIGLVPGTTDVLEAQLATPAMNIDETRELGLKLCAMFGFDSNAFLAWCHSVGNKWLDAQLFVIDNNTDHSFKFEVRRAYNDQKPWWIIFTVANERAVAKLLETPSH